MISSDFATLPLKLDDFPKPSGHNWHHPFPPELPHADAMLPTHPVTCNPTHCKGSQAAGEKGMIHGNLLPKSGAKFQKLRGFLASICRDLLPESRKKIGILGQNQSHENAIGNRFTRQLKA